MIRNPRYPTVTPKTICEDLREYGTWMIVQDDVSKEKEIEIRALQDKCLAHEKNPHIIIPPFRPPPPSPELPPPFQHPPFMPLDDKRYNICVGNVTEEFKNLNKYCKYPDGSSLIMKDLTETFCKTGVYDLVCAFPSGFTSCNQSGDCSYQGEIFVGEELTEEEAEEERMKEKMRNVKHLNLRMDGKLSCSPTPFNRTVFETSLHDNFLSKKCNDVDGRCKVSGLIPSLDNVEQLSAINRGFNERWYSDIELLEKRNTKTEEDIPRVQRKPPISPSSGSDFLSEFKKDKKRMEFLAAAAAAAREEAAAEAAANEQRIDPTMNRHRSVIGRRRRKGH